MATFRDDLEFTKPVTFTDTVDLSGATITYPTGGFANITTGVRPVQFYGCPFDALNLQEGGFVASALPANVLILGVHIQMTTALTFSSGNTTGVSAKIGTNDDDDAFGLSMALAGAIGLRRPTPGALIGGVVEGGSYGPVVAFTATGGTPNLAHVLTGEGKLVIHFIEID